MSKDKKEKDKKSMLGTYTKKLVAIVVGISLIDVQLSYLLAFMGKDSLESVSNQLIITILGTSIVYMIRAWFDSWAENKNINTDSTDNILSDLDNEINNNMMLFNQKNTEDETTLIEDNDYGN